MQRLVGWLILFHGNLQLKLTYAELLKWLLYRMEDFRKIIDSVIYFDILFNEKT